MFRLRTTLVLSALAMGVGIAGTDWLSRRSSEEPLFMLRLADVPRSPSLLPHHRTAPVKHHSLAIADVSGSHRRRIEQTTSRISEPPYDDGRAVPPPELIPLAMPQGREFAYDRLRGHLDGRLVVHVSVDGSGRVIAASVAESSGDAVLDAHAVRSVRGWSFAVPIDRPDGLSGDLPMRFSSHDDPVASLR